MSIEYLVEKYSKLVYKICYDMLKNSLDAEDTTQEVYMRLYANRERYQDLTENELKNIICKIALNRCKDILKSKAKKLERMTTGEIISLENYESDHKIEEEIVKKEQSLYIQKIINELKEPYATILYDYYIKEMSLDELSDRMGVVKTTLKMQLYRGKKLLKEKLKVEVGGDNL